MRIILPTIRTTDLERIEGQDRKKEEQGGNRDLKNGMEQMQGAMQYMYTKERGCSWFDRRWFCVSLS